MYFIVGHFIMGNFAEGGGGSAQFWKYAKYDPPFIVARASQCFSLLTHLSFYRDGTSMLVFTLKLVQLSRPSVSGGALSARIFVSFTCILLMSGIVMIP